MLASLLLLRSFIFSATHPSSSRPPSDDDERTPSDLDPSARRTWAHYYSQALHFRGRKLTLWHHQSRLNAACVCMGTGCSRLSGCWGAQRASYFLFLQQFLFYKSKDFWLNKMVKRFQHLLSQVAPVSLMNLTPSRLGLIRGVGSSQFWKAWTAETLARAQDKTISSHDPGPGQSTPCPYPLTAALLLKYLAGQIFLVYFVYLSFLLPAEYKVCGWNLVFGAHSNGKTTSIGGDFSF